jgi:uncharacterized cupredoxin-like copper-binding protein
MAVDDPVGAAVSPSAPARPPVGRDTTSVVAVVIASIAMVAALVSIGFAARAVNEANRKVQQAQTAAGAGGGAAALGVTERDYAISAQQPNVLAGAVELHVTNNGPSAHQLLIFRTDLAPDRLPVSPTGGVDEQGAGVQKVFDSAGTIAAGATKTFLASLPPGHYVLVCNLPGHYQSGMHTALTVTGPA